MGKFRKPKPDVWTLTIIDNGEDVDESFRFHGTIYSKGWYDGGFYSDTREGLERKAARHKALVLAHEAAVANAVTVTL